MQGMSRHGNLVQIPVKLVLLLIGAVLDPIIHRLGFDCSMIINHECAVKLSLLGKFNNFLKALLNSIRDKNVFLASR